MKNCNKILKNEAAKYQRYHLEKLINIDILQVKKYSNQRQIIEQTIFTHSPLETASEKQILKNISDRFDEIKELTDEIKQNDLIIYLKSNTSRKRFDDFNNVIELVKAIKSGEKKLEEAKKLQNLFKSNRNKISRER